MENGFGKTKRKCSATHGCNISAWIPLGCERKCYVRCRVPERSWSRVGEKVLWYPEGSLRSLKCLSANREDDSMCYETNSLFRGARCFFKVRQNI